MDLKKLDEVMVAFPNVSIKFCDRMYKTDSNCEQDKRKPPNQGVWKVLVHQKGKQDSRPGNAAKLRPSLPKPRPLLSSVRNDRTPVDTNDPESLHSSIGGVLILAQIFGILPVIGVRASSPSKLNFSKFSFRTIYAIIIILMIFFMAVISVNHMIKTLNSKAFEVQGGIAAATAGAIFYGNSLLANILFFRLSPRWVNLQKNWHWMEQFIDSNKPVRPKLRWKMILISSVILLLALTEHLLSIANNTVRYNWNSDNATFYNFIHVYTVTSHAFILETVNYSFGFGIFIFVVSKIATFSWNFMDVFIMLMSTALAERYKSLNKYIMTSTYKERSTIDWCELREDYAALSTMVKKMDNDISPIILLSFANNLYFICLQLLNGISGPEESTLLSNLYFFGSFGFLIGRTCGVTLLAARINDQSKQALPALYSCSASTFNVETQRLLYQLTTDDVVLTGLRFFSITRNFMLAVAGAILTYEVILLQFNVSIKR